VVPHIIFIYVHDIFYKAHTLFGLGVSVSNTDTTKTHDYIELYNFFKFLSVLTCQCQNMSSVQFVLVLHWIYHYGKIGYIYISDLTLSKLGAGLLQY
jgi:hypothetical protein